MCIEDIEEKCTDAVTQTDISPLPQCEQCAEDTILLNELNVLLETVNEHIETSSAINSISQKDIDELVQNLAAIEEDISSQNVKHITNTTESLPSVSSTTHASGTAYIPSLNDTSLHHANKFQPLQYINNDCQTQLPTSPIPLRPGPHLYSDMVKKTATTMIITDSMGGGIKMSNIKRNIGVKDRTTVIKRFPGHTADEISYYAPKPLKDNQPDQVIIIAGTNDLTRSVYGKGTIDEFEVVKSILDIGRAARNEGANKIHISSIMARRRHQYVDVVQRVNNVLYMACVAEDFLFVDLDDINLAHISSDGVHLNSYLSLIHI